MSDQPDPLTPTDQPNSSYSLVVTGPTTNPPICGLCMAERTGCPVLHSLWLHLRDERREEIDIQRIPALWHIVFE